ncbi:MAG TPA: polysaccharide biosynthesis/export family protein [Saprospiraceae bacterium]|nr:polysaccharide biosynthesis/export family protein [Bacteroidia bacterium]HNG07151.1 polysaccharide biosynthesis/export family protein [Saprospiraceae bacterium]HNI93972.1 polysaccharide biosynthesis/export family protein [Saprospiraceae bacterium]HNL30797.1 polysaccharide biosynthesis/export family protein [Saprospiraceae bacterium]
MIKQKNHYLWVVALLLIVSSCSSVKEMTYMQDLPEGQSRTVLETIGYKDPMIESGDILSINVSTIDPTTSEAINQSMMIPAIGYSSTNSSVSSQQVIAGFPVDEEGNITMNYTGKIHVGGLTLAQAREKVESEVAKYFKNAVVNIAYTNFRVTVLGEVNAPGIVVFPRKNVNILEAIGMSGDLTLQGRRDNVLLIRKLDDTHNEYIRVNLNKSDFMTSPYFYMKQGDILYVSPSDSRSVVNNADRIQLISIITSIASTAALITTVILNARK